jgi:thioredoxin reductase (NADPH)
MHDIIIIGGGPAGMACAMYAARAGLDTLIIERKACGGNIILTDKIENYPGFGQGITGFDLATNFIEQALGFGAKLDYSEVINIDNANIKTVFTKKMKYQAKALVIATGMQFKKLGIKGEDEFNGKGVSYCAVCDGPFFKGKTVAVIGGGDSAVEEAVYLSNLASQVILLHRRDELRANKFLQEKLFERKNITVKYDTVPTEILGRSCVYGLKIINTKTQENTELSCDGVFVFIGHNPNSAPFNFLKIDEEGYIITDENMQAAPGIFACGDIRQKSLRQVVTAVSDGAIAAMAVERYLSF